MPDGNGQPSTGLIALGAGAMVLCCLAPVLLASTGAAGIVALISGNVWWLVPGLGALALAVVLGRRRRASHRAPEPFRKKIANE